MNVLPAHLRELCRPKMIPERVIRRVRNAGIKANLPQLPILLLTQCSRQRGDIVIWERVSKSISCRVKEILAVNECNGAFDCRFSGHIKNNPARGRYRRVERGVDKSSAPRCAIILN